jgi:hypothetical protein
LAYPRYIVFDDAPETPGIDWTADQIADALRAPLGMIGVRVIRQQGSRSKTASAGFQGRGSSRRQFAAVHKKVDDIVNDVVNKATRPI